MSKKFFNKISFFSFVFFTHFLFASLDHQGLFDIMKRYKKIDLLYHFGHPLEHSTWVAKAIEQWFDTSDEWVEGLEQHKRVLIAAGFLHDIGKVGDLNFVFISKPTHPRDGISYMSGVKEFKIPDSNSLFDFDAYFKQLLVSEDEIKIIKILVASHWYFGGLVMDPWEKRAEENRTVAFEEGLFETFLRNTDALVKEVGYNGGVIDETIIKMSMLIAAADWKGLAPVDLESKVFPELKNCLPYRKGIKLYESKNRDKGSKEVHKKILIYFREKFSKEVKA